MSLDHTRDTAHGHVVTDPYPRFIRETLVDGGEPDVRVMLMPQYPGTYAVFTKLHFDCLDVFISVEITRDEYDEASPSEIVDLVQARWYDRLLDLRDWIEDRDNELCED